MLPLFKIPTLKEVLGALVAMFKRFCGFDVFFFVPASDSNLEEVTLVVNTLDFGAGNRGVFHSLLSRHCQIWKEALMDVKLKDFKREQTSLLENPSRKKHDFTDVPQ